MNKLKVYLPIFIVAAVAIITAPLWLPPVKSLISKIPVVGPLLA